MSETLCPLPWLHFSVNTDTAIRVCCNTDHSGRIQSDDGSPVFLSEIKSVADYYNNRFMREMRRRMMNGEKPEFCKKCFDIEGRGGTSVRQAYVRQFERQMAEILPKTAPDGTTPVDIRYIDLSLSNICNLKCRMCSPGSSNHLRKDFEVLGIRYDAEYADRASTGWEKGVGVADLLEPHLGKTEEMLTTGGEPFLSIPHRMLLRKLIAMGRAKDVVLRYHSNMSSLPDELIQLWRHFRKIEVHVSVEGYGHVNEYIRYKSEWPVFTGNLDRLLDLRPEINIWVEFHTCLQAYNFLSIPRLLEFTREYGSQVPAMPYFIWIDSPAILSATVLPASLKLLGVQRIESYLESNERALVEGDFQEFNRGAIALLRSHLVAVRNSAERPEAWKEFLDYTKRLDGLRGQSFEVLVPEFGRHLSPYMNSVNSASCI